MKISVLLFSIVFAITFSGCARSNNYRQSQTYYGGADGSYYSQPDSKLSPTKRIQMLGQPKKKVVVLNFWNSTPVQDRTIGKYVADELRRQLYVTDRMILPKDLQARVETSQFLEGDQVKVGQLIREGRRMGVSILVIGRVSRIVFRQRGDDVGLFKQTQSLGAVDLEVKIFDIESGREVTAVGRSGEASSNAMVAIEGEDLKSKEFRGELARLASRNAVQFIVPDVIRSIEKISWQGQIAKIVGTKVYLNSGRKSGLVNGDILKVLTPGEDVYDPTTGSYLGRTQGQLKGTLEVKDFIGPDAAVAEMHSGGNFAQGDTVHLY